MIYLIFSALYIYIFNYFIISRLTADILTNILEEQYKKIWMRRHTYNYIVILDQGTEDIEDDQKLINLRNALLKWDPMHDNSKKLKFLKGGYEDFNHLCPWETTQHYKTNPNEDVDEPLSDVEIEPEPECQELESSKSKTNI